MSDVTNSISELDKWSNVFLDVRTINDFLDFLNEQKIILCDKSKENPEYFLPILNKRDDIIAQYFNIDLNQLDKERRKLLESLKD